MRSHILFKDLREAIVISQEHVYDMVKDLHDAGIKIGFMCGVDDPVFSNEIHYQESYAKGAEEFLTMLTEKR